MLHIEFTNGEHTINWLATEEQQELMRVYRQPLKRKLAEEQAARYRQDPDKYRSLSSVVSLLEEGIYSPYLGAIGGGDTFIMHKTEDDYAVQYSYLESQSIWLTEELGIQADNTYRVTPTSLGYIVIHETDISKYGEW